MHKKIMKKCASKLMKDAKHYKKEEREAVKEAKHLKKASKGKD